MISEREEKDLLRVVFDAMPSMVFIVDKDVSIEEFNKSASELIAAEKELVLHRRAGEVLHCLHSNEGCGKSPFCMNCVIRNSVNATFQGNSVSRKRTRMELIHSNAKKEIYALITVSPFEFQKKLRALLVIEDISEIAELQQLIPICYMCYKVKDDNHSWKKLELYFRNKWDVDFTHGLCPDCLKSELNKIKCRKQCEVITKIQ